MPISTLFGQPANPATLVSDTASYEMGVQFTVSQPATVTGIWFFSASGATDLPSEIDLYDAPGGNLHAQQASPSWSGAAGSGWVKATFATPPVVLPGYSYKACILHTTAVNFYASTAHYWDTGPGQNGITSGILTAPNNAGGDHGQDTFFTPTAVHIYPNNSFNASNYWIDVEVTSDPTQPLGSISGGPWTMVFNDEFNTGTTPNPATWDTHYMEGNAFRQQNGGTEIGWSPPNAQGMAIANSILTITATNIGAWPAMLAIDPNCPNPSVSKIANPSCPQPSYVTGVIQCRKAFSCTYGYVEALIQMPTAANSWPAFWRHDSDGGWPPEIDIMESITPPTVTGAYHDPNSVTTSFSYPGTNDYTNWHVFGLRWTPNDITWFLDGFQQNTYTTVASITTIPMQLIFDLAVQNGAVFSTAAMKIDYVRAWTIVGVPAQPAAPSMSPPTGVPGADGKLIASFATVPGATSYRVTACPLDAAADNIVDGPHVSATGAASPLTMTGLHPGAHYTVTVAAINATGYSIESLPAAPGGGSTDGYHRTNRRMYT